MGRECRLYGGEEKCLESFGRETKECDLSEYVGAGGSILVKQISTRYDSRACILLIWHRTGTG
jgi:hypothetical protein